jgi:hypothetical protein
MNSIERRLQSIGKEFFIKYLELLKNSSQFTNTDAIQIIIKNEGYTETATRTRVYNSRKIINSRHQYIEALENITNSNISES